MLALYSDCEAKILYSVLKFSHMSECNHIYMECCVLAWMIHTVCVHVWHEPVYASFHVACSVAS